MPTHSSEVLLLTTEELSALGTALGLTPPASISTIVGRLPTPPAPSSATTTLAATITAAATTVTFADGNLPVRDGSVLLCGTERMGVRSVLSPTSAIVIRGTGGTTAATHANGASVSLVAGNPTERATLKVAAALVGRQYEPMPVS